MYPYVDELVLELLSWNIMKPSWRLPANRPKNSSARGGQKIRRQIHLCGGRRHRHQVQRGLRQNRRSHLSGNRQRGLPQAAAAICIGACASFGGIQAAEPNPGGYKGVGEALGIKTVNIAGCPPNPVNFVGTIVNYLLLGKLPALDNLGRPLFAYGKTIHDQCPRRVPF